MAKERSSIDRYKFATSVLGGGLMGAFAAAVTNDFAGGIDNAREFFFSFYNFPLWPLPAPVPDVGEMFGSLGAMIVNASENGIAKLALWTTIGASLKGGYNYVKQKNPWIGEKMDQLTTLPFSPIEAAMRPFITAPLGAAIAVMAVHYGSLDSFFNFAREAFTNEETLYALGGGYIAGLVVPNLIYNALKFPIAVVPEAARLGFMGLVNPVYNLPAMMQNFSNAASKTTKQILGGTVLSTAITAGITLGMHLAYGQFPEAQSVPDLAAQTDLASGLANDAINTALTGFNHVAEYLRALIFQPFLQDWLGPKVIGEAVEPSSRAFLGLMGATGGVLGGIAGWAFNRKALNIKDEETYTYELQLRGPAQRKLEMK